MKKLIIATFLAASVWGCGNFGDGAAGLAAPGPPAGPQDIRAAGGDAPPVVLQDFNGRDVPVNRAGDAYPSPYAVLAAGGGRATVSLDGDHAREGRNCLRLDFTLGRFYVQFNPYDEVGGRGFAREYITPRASWKFDTYNRLSFWVSVPPAGAPLGSGGRPNVELGTYVKRVTRADTHSDEAGGGHYYHMLNLPNLGVWTKVVINMHPDHARGDSGGVDPGVLPYPTARAGGDPAGAYNYFDTLTRFYLADYAGPPRSYPATYRIDDVRFYREPAVENDAQVYSLTGTYDPGSNRLIVTWSRAKNDNDVVQEVRYGFTDIHRSGWGAATPAPKGVLKPPGFQGYNGMVYDTKALPLAGHDTVYIAIRPRNSRLFTQIALPLSRPAGPGGRPRAGTPPDKGGR